MNKFIAICVLCVMQAAAQEGTEKVTVPLHDASRPAKIRAHLISGGIIVRGADRKDVLVEVRSSGRVDSDERRPERAGGMRRLDLPGAIGFDVDEADNVVNIKTSPRNKQVDLVITVPRRSSLDLKCLNNGDILVEGVEGEIDADDLNGKVTLNHVSGSVVAHSLNGALTVSIDREDPSKPMSFSTLNGDIDVTLPATTKANVRMKTDNGSIYSDFEVKLAAQSSPVAPDSGKQKDGTFRLRFDRMLRGTINGGGPDYQFVSFNGQIYIRQRK